MLRDSLKKIGTSIDQLSEQIKTILILILSFYDDRDKNTGGWGTHKLAGNGKFWFTAGNANYYSSYTPAELAIVKKSEEKRAIDKNTRKMEIAQNVGNLKEDLILIVSNNLALDIGMFRIGFKYYLEINKQLEK